MMLDFYKGKNIFISGHTGFKGTWLSKILIMAGAKKREGPFLTNVIELVKVFRAEYHPLFNRTGDVIVLFAFCV